MAANAGAIRAGRAFVEAYLDDSKLQSGLKSVKSQLNAFAGVVAKVSTAFLGLGTAIGGALAIATTHFIQAGDELEKMSHRTGLTVEALSELAYAAGQSGTDTDTLNRSLLAMAKLFENASSGGKGALETLFKLGLTLQQLQAMSPEQRFMRFADAVASVRDPGLRAALAMEVFGKSGAQLLPLLANGAAGVQELRDRARELGLVMSTDDANAAVTLGDRLDDLWKQFDRLKQIIGAALAPVLTDLANKAIEMATTVIRWIDANRELVTTVAAVAAGLTAMGASGLALAGVIKGLAIVVGGLGTAIGLIATPVGAVIASVTLLATILEAQFGIISDAINASRIAMEDFLVSVGLLDVIEWNPHFVDVSDEVWQQEHGGKAATDAEKELQQALEQAKEETARLRKELEGGPGKPLGEGMPDLMVGLLAEMKAGKSSLVSKANRIGTFSSIAEREIVSGLDGGEPVDLLRQIARNTRKTADNGGQRFT